LAYPHSTTASSKSPVSAKYHLAVHGGRPVGLSMKITSLFVSPPLFLSILSLQSAAYKRQFSELQLLFAVLLRAATLPTQYSTRPGLLKPSGLKPILIRPPIWKRFVMNKLFCVLFDVITIKNLRNLSS